MASESSAREDSQTGVGLRDKKKLPKMKGMEKMVFAKYDGVNIPQGRDDGHVEETVKKMKEKIRDFTIRDDDTIIVGHPRCGNHWTFEVVNMIVRQETTYSPMTFVNSVIEMFKPEIEKLLNDLESPRVLCQHSYLRDLPTQAIQKRTKIIYLVRDPRSALVSFYKARAEMRDDALRFTGTWDDFFEAIMAREFVWGNIIDHFKDMEDFRKKHPECPIYIRSFKKGVEDPVQQIQELCAFLGKPEHLASNIAKATGFDAMKKGTKKKMEGEEGLFFEKGKKGFLVGAKTGVWKDVFTVAQSERLSKDIGEKLDGTEIATLV